MSAKINAHSKRELTHLNSGLVRKMRNADYLYNSLAAGSKNRLSQYRKNIMVSRGTADNEVLFDKSVMKLLKDYIYPDIKFNNQLNYLEKLRDEDGYRFSRNLRIYKSTSESFELFSSKQYTSFRWNEHYQKSLKLLRLKLKHNRLQPLHYCSDDDIMQALPRLDTHSGYTYIESGKKYKGQNLEGIFKRYTKAKLDALITGSFNRPVLIGFRTQASGEYDDNGNQTGTCKHKTRVVSMVDLLLLIAEMTFMKPIQLALNKEDWYTGGKNDTAISRIMSNMKHDYSWFESIDYSSFDQTVPSWLLEDVWDILIEIFNNLSDEDRRLYEIVKHDTVTKDFILGEGILHSESGLPSGYNFTNAGGSAMNFVIINTYLSAKGLKGDMIICGDDNCIFTKDKIDIEDLASYVKHNFGMIIKTDDKTNGGSAKTDDPKFLSRYWKPGGQYRNEKQLLSRLLYPERKRDYTKEIGPQHVIFAYILAYPLGMQKLLNVNKFMRDYPISIRYVLENVGSRYVPGIFSYMREYVES